MNCSNCGQKINDDFIIFCENKISEHKREIAKLEQKIKDDKEAHEEGYCDVECQEHGEQPTAT